VRRLGSPQAWPGGRPRVEIVCRDGPATCAESVSHALPTVGRPEMTHVCALARLCGRAHADPLVRFAVDHHPGTAVPLARGEVADADRPGQATGGAGCAGGHAGSYDGTGTRRGQPAHVPRAGLPTPLLRRRFARADGPWARVPPPDPGTRSRRCGAAGRGTHRVQRPAAVGCGRVVRGFLARITPHGPAAPMRRSTARRTTANPSYGRAIRILRAPGTPWPAWRHPSRPGPSTASATRGVRGVLTRWQP
jgi:hypothetical protein